MAEKKKDKANQQQDGQGKQKGQAKQKGEAQAKGKKSSDRPRASASKESPARLRVAYLERVVPALTKEFKYANVMAVPKVAKVSVNVGMGEATQNVKTLDPAVKELTQITGQRPVITKARKSIAAFKLREGMPIGCAVTLRGDRMYEFLDRLFNISLPRVRDFRGVSTKAFDGRGNYTFGVKDQLIFPEIDYNKVDKARGMNICITTTANTDAEGMALLRHLGMPFAK